MTTCKPKINIENVKAFLEETLKERVKDLVEVPSGKIKTAYFFNYKDKDYVIRFSQDNYDFDLEKYLQNILKDKGVPFAKLISMGKFNDMYYAISEKLEGTSIDTLEEKELMDTLQSLMIALVNLHSIDIDDTKGYGWFDDNRNGSFNSFSQYLEKFFGTELDGFWNGWYRLFEDSFLDQNLFNDLYKKMMELAPFCEGRRHMVHSDFHYHNVIVKNCNLQGIIDWGRVSYLDYIFDIATLVMEFPNYNLLDKFETFYGEQGMDVSNIKERLLCAALCNSLDGMRFWAKLGHQGSYKAIVDNILKILNVYGVSI